MSLLRRPSPATSDPAARLVLPRCPVFVVVENRLMRDLVKELLANREEFDVVGVEPRADAAALRQMAARGDLVVLHSPSDLSSAEHLGRQIAPFRHISARIRVVLFGMPAEEALFFAAVRNGAAGYVLEESSPADLLAAVGTVSRGEVACSPRMLPALFRSVASQAFAPPGGAAAASSRLTRRERELVPMIARGMTNKEIAAELGLSEYTVKNHLHRILRKTGAGSRRRVAERSAQAAAVSSGA